jgi:hypothetical protein
MRAVVTIALILGLAYVVTDGVIKLRAEHRRRARRPVSERRINEMWVIFHDPGFDGIDEAAE